MGCVLAAIIFEHFLERKTVYLSFLLLFASFGFVLGNPSKPLLPIKYFCKKFLSYAPVAICPVNSLQENLIKQKLGKFYLTVPNESNCFILKQNPTKQDRAAIFQLLDSSGYYDNEKFETVFDLDKDKMYFLNHSSDYANLKELIIPLKNVDGNIGILFKGGQGYYHYWAVAQNEKVNFGQMDYIGFRARYARLRNAKKEFCYKYIFGDDPSLLDTFYKKKLIDTISYSNTFYLAKLKQTACDKIIITD